MNTTTITTTTIWGPTGRVLQIATSRGATPVTTHYGDGQRVTSPVVSFDGGYDDYEGSCAYAEIPGDFPGTPTRFSPRPGQWMSGIRLTPGGGNGHLYRLLDGEWIRPATESEAHESAAAAGSGINHSGAIVIDGISCYVSL